MYIYTGAYFKQNQTHPDWDGPLWSKRVFTEFFNWKKLYIYYKIYLVIKNKSTVSV